MAKVGDAGRGSCAPIAPGERTVAAAAHSRGGASRTPRFGPPPRGSGPRIAWWCQPNQARAGTGGPASSSRLRGLAHRWAGSPPDRPQHRPERLGDLQLLFRPVGGEGGEEAVAVTVDAEHGGIEIAGPQPDPACGCRACRGDRGRHPMAQPQPSAAAESRCLQGGASPTLTLISDRPRMTHVLWWDVRLLDSR